MVTKATREAVTRLGAEAHFVLDVGPNAGECRTCKVVRFAPKKGRAPERLTVAVMTAGTEIDGVGGYLIRDVTVDDAVAAGGSIHPENACDKAHKGRAAAARREGGEVDEGDDDGEGGEGGEGAPSANAGETGPAV